MAKRGRKRKEVVEESDVVQLQQHSTVFPSPVQANADRPANRRVTRQSIGILRHCASSTTPMRYPLRILSDPSQRSTGARRVLLEANDRPCPASIDLQASHRHILDFPELPPSPVIRLSYYSPHAEGDRSGKNDFSHGNITPDLLSQPEKLQEFQPIVPQIQSQDMLPMTQATVAQNATTDVSEKIAFSHSENSIQLSRSASFNMTEIAIMCNDSSPDDDEVESAYDPALVMVKAYRVKQEVAHLLRDIFAKYGDIAQDSVLKSSESRSHFLEMVCCIYENLKKKILTEITLVELDAMLRNVDDLESMKINVGWLHMKLTEIKEAKELLRDYAGFKEEKAKIVRKEKELESNEVELVILKQKVLLLKDELSTMKTKHQQSVQKFLKKEKVKSLFENGLVDGLL